METINIIVAILTSLSVILFPIGIILSVVLAILASNQKDVIKKKKMNSWAIFSCVAPILLFFVLLSFWGLYGVVTSTISPQDSNITR